MVEPVENRNRQVENHMEFSEMHQEVNDSTGHSGKGSHVKYKNETITQAEKPNNKKSQQQSNSANQKNAFNNHNHSDIIS